MTLKFGELEKVATDDGFIWYAEMKLMSEIFGQVTFCLVSTDMADVDDETTLLVERIASDIDRYVKEALIFLKDELRRGCFLSEDELNLLDVPVFNLPFSSPQCTFYARDKQWLMRFAEGELDICEPYGIGVIFEGEKLLCLENLELSSEC
ncbi:hypothetical protein [Campylobacter concisus]|jgi:hypothetical protein|uniref:DUF2262 domain-containing protein n=1 Tax=Campylobacter concisus TaxID=199 RepID=A0A7S9SBQ7_9BACT|nr:hypothetical protein [Campylobacter concisus]MCA6130163.1 hypothetical protein [Campylobacter concisus]MCA6132211.1 hypothetical protein [Campylobacter concisus]QPI06982.1 hypothetical protein G5B96_06500 [Campylobacter concisus]